MTDVRIVYSIDDIQFTDNDFLLCVKNLDFVPEFVFGHDAGLDLFANIEKEVKIGNSNMIPLGVKSKLPLHTFVMIVPRSGMSYRSGFGFRILNSPGIIDASYRNEWCVLLGTDDKTDIVIKPKQKICQAIIKATPFYRSSGDLIIVVNEDEFNIWHELFPSTRGLDGFGSTGYFRRRRME